MKRFFLALLLPACVVTTLEGPSEPPRVTPPPGREARNAEPAVESGPEQIGARHLLVSYRGAMRASPSVTRTKEEARARVQEAMQKARGGADFEALVKEYSDEPGAAERNGDLGKFKRSMMVKPFADAAFKLSPGELSDVVETPFGFHVIQRTE
ncbi:MAG: peptidyl-prolyl cis-trans isomerase [Polyangiaceae bacterium]